jgi:hypothetical protein
VDDGPNNSSLGALMDRILRGDNRNDPAVAKLTEDPGIKAALEAHRMSKAAEVQAQLHNTIDGTDERKLCGWVTVAVWEDETGKVSQSLIGDSESTFFEMKGYLHDAVWTAAHADH